MAANPQFVLTQRTPHSYHATNPATIAHWLIQQGFTNLRTCSEQELARLRRNHEIVVVYRSGSVLCQGAAYDAAMRRLAALVQEQVETVSMFDLLEA
jgi:hypothetical protein